MPFCFFRKRWRGRGRARGRGRERGRGRGRGSGRCFVFEQESSLFFFLFLFFLKNDRTLRNSGRRVFLATNSLWDYTDVVMRHLLGGGVSQTTGAPLWLDLFDVVVTGCGKPAFFKESRPLLEVDPATGLLRNTDSGTPMVPIGEADLPSRGSGRGGSGGRSKGVTPRPTSTTPTSTSPAVSSFASGASTSTSHPSVQMASRRGPARVFQGGCAFVSRCRIFCFFWRERKKEKSTRKKITKKELTLFFLPPQLSLYKKKIETGPIWTCTGDWASRAGQRCAVSCPFFEWFSSDFKG